MPTRTLDSRNGTSSKESPSVSIGDSGIKCAWCLEEQNIAPENESHGICKRHSRLLIKEFSPIGHSHTKSLAQSPVDESTNNETL